VSGPARGRRRGLVALAVLCLVAAFMPSAAASAAKRPLQTAFTGSEVFDGPGGDLAFARTRDAGATAFRLDIRWNEIAPQGATRPAGFDPARHTSPLYRWGVFDAEVRRAVGHGLAPIASIHSAPDWAEGPGPGPDGTVSPDPIELARFAGAAAERYSGRVPGLPRVRYWQAWNEPNLNMFLNPQRNGKRFPSPDHYRRMVNAFAKAVHAVHRSNRVVAGGLSPFSDAEQQRAIAPLNFMRRLLCVSKRGRPTCRKRVRFDIWSTHPYTSGNPTHHANGVDDVSLGDLPQMRRLLTAAVRARKVVSRRAVPFWVTEFSWDSNPPDASAVPADVLVRWVAEGLYRMWSSGVSLVAWFQLRDNDNNGRPDSQVFQSGLYYRCPDGLACDRPKPALQAFRFPFAAFRARGGVKVWARTPGGRPAKLVVQRAVGAGFRDVARVRTDRHGIVNRRVRAPRRGTYRIVNAANGDASPPFTIGRTPDLRVNPFG
jgi:hypothetical protein